MKFALVGHFCFDIHHSGNGSDEERPGGIFNAAAMLSRIAGRSNTIVPVFGVAKEDYARVSGLLEELPGVSMDGVYKIDAPTNRVHVYSTPEGRSVACSKDIAPPISFDRLRRHISADGILINMISGFDITLETLDQVRMLAREEKTVIHFDVHNLTLGLNERHERFRRPVEAWRRWAFMIDTVQLNEEELLGLDAAISDERSIVGHILTLGVRGVLVTRGANGVTVYLDTQKHVSRQDIEIVPSDGEDLIGSGDRFGAAFLYGLVTSNDIAGSARTAVESLSRTLNHN